ncbi:ubiquinone biosynthesis accessory factor UbiJ [Natronospira bacteriovora]|uniref:Ubiquinone biosynthesis accessory factor UbiJ n=1 Tax=Natronospira bacteriovora TaxID=3069753 RepID=A0ABU0W774_9GAMM|nr:SCP2 sterol-binding domain-containing protein [Natronospira sp. AB-CW4]MDQ2069859.1 SCP2 sterol-binding domain-containing protein [Natronospira sp. AB-CW4]
MQIPTIILSTLERSINRVLMTAAGGQAAIQGLDGKVLELHLDDLDVSVWIASNGRSLRLSAVDPGHRDLKLSGRSVEMLKAALEGRAEGRFPSEVSVEGDMDTARQVQQLLKALDPDWEEALAGVTGDAVARGVGSVTRQGLAWGRETADVLSRNLAEFLRDELRLVPDRSEVEAYMDAVDQLRDDVERLAARLDHFGEGRRS